MHKLIKIFANFQQTFSSKLVYLCLLSFLMSLSINIIKVLKNTSVVVYIDAEIISFIKFYLEIPFALLFIFCYGHIRKSLSVENAFICIFVFFSATFMILAFMLPNRQYIIPNIDMMNYYINSFPHYKWILLLIQNWDLILFYVLGEIYPVVLYSIFFWQLANNINSFEESKYMYYKIMLCGHASLLLLNFTIKSASFINHFGNYPVSSTLMLVNIILSCFVVKLYKFIELKFTESLNHKPLDDKCNFELILKSKQLFLILISIVCYASIAIILEGVLMFKIKKAYNTYSGFANYYSHLLLYTSIFTVLLSSIGFFLLRILGLKVSIFLTPFVNIFLGCTFLVLVYLDMHAAETLILIGSAQYILLKVSKYVFFDATKEMIYIKLLKKEVRSDGKFIVEMLGMKIGKLIGSAPQVIILTFYPTYEYQNIIIFLFWILLYICTVWIYVSKIISCMVLDLR
jgi:AAA family ATP:ADP antiporter